MFSLFLFCGKYAGFFYCGFVQYGVYNKLYPMLFKNMQQGFKRNVATTMTDMVCHSSLFYFPAFYIFKGFVYQRSVSMDVIKQQLHEYFVINFKEDMAHLYTVWLPTTFLMFAVIPIQYRVPWVSTIGILWATILSLKRGDDAQQNKTEVIQSDVKELRVNQVPLFGQPQQAQY